MKNLLLFVLYIMRSILAPVMRFREVSVLAYHALSEDSADTSVSPQVFEHQLQALLDRGYTFVPLSEVIAWQQGTGDLPLRAIAVTFDDGYADFESAALPILEGLNVPATLFIVADREAYRRTLSTMPAMLSAEAVGRLEHHPLVELGYHTKTHPDVRKLDTKGLHAECIPPAPMRYFAYPGGGYSEQARSVLLEAGYEAAFSIKPELVRIDQDPYLLPRIVVTRGMRDWELLALVTKASAWYRSIRRIVRYG